MTSENNSTNANSEDTQADKSWLKRLKNESWQAELLVSTVAIFGTFELFNILDWVTLFFINQLPPSQHYIGYFILFFGLIAVSILATMFIIHFILRAYWIGLVGLNSVFPDYNVEDSPYSRIYTEKITSILPKLKDSINKVDDLCSVIFSTAFTFLVIYLFMAFTASVYLLVYNLLLPYIPFEILILPLVINALIIVVQTIFAIIANMKKYRENHRIQQWNFSLVKLSWILMMGPLYKSILQITMIFGSNFKKRKSMVYLMILFITVGVTMAVARLLNSKIVYFISKAPYMDDNKAFSSYYFTNNSEEDFLLMPEINEDRIYDGTVRLFIPIYNHELRQIKGVCPEIDIEEDLTKDEKRKIKREAKLRCYTSVNHVYLNEEKVSVEFMRYTHPVTGQFGVVTYLDVSNLPKGIQRIGVEKDYGEEYQNSWSIPFYNIP